MATAETSPHFFTVDQLATLNKLGSILVPPIKDKPGALDAQAPEFLDFLLSVSPRDRQTSYQHGLDTLNAEAKKAFGKPFSSIDSKQADTLIRPTLLVARPLAPGPSEGRRCGKFPRTGPRGIFARRP